MVVAGLNPPPKTQVSDSRCDPARGFDRGFSGLSKRTVIDQALIAMDD